MSLNSMVALMGTVQEIAVRAAAEAPQNLDLYATTLYAKEVWATSPRIPKTADIHLLEVILPLFYTAFGLAYAGRGAP